MGKCDHSIRHKGLNTASHLVNIRYTIVYIIHLTVSCQLAVDCLTHHLLIVFHHIGLNGSPVHRRLLQHTHIPYAAHSHIQGAGNGGGRQSQYIYRREFLFDLLFLCHAEALLLIHNQQPQILKANVLADNPVRTYQQIHPAVRQIL